jgi:hypothetical protein
LRWRMFHKSNLLNKKSIIRPFLFLHE